MYRITKKEISEDIKSSRITGLRTYHEYKTIDDKFSVNCFKCSTRVEQIENGQCHGLGFCANKKDFIEFLYNELN